MNFVESLESPLATHEARALVVNFRREGCSSLVLGLDGAGFTVIEGGESWPEIAGEAHIVVFAVSGLEEEACGALRQFTLSVGPKAIPVLVVADRFEASIADEYLGWGATDFLSQPSSGRVLRGWCERILQTQKSDRLFDQYLREQRRSGAFDRIIVPLSLALFAERDYGKMLEKILLEAKALCHADGGTLYIRTPEDTLEFSMVHNDTLGISLGGSKGPVAGFSPIRLYRQDTGGPEHRYIAAHVAHTGESIVLSDLYDASNFDLSGPRQFDAKHGYRTKSVLAAPLKDETGRVVGILQLINARDPMSGEVIEFEPHQQEAIASLCRLAAAGLDAYSRMQKLRDQIQALNLEIDEVKKNKQVAQITESDYFQKLKEKARHLRSSSQNP